MSVERKATRLISDFGSIEDLPKLIKESIKRRQRLLSLARTEETACDICCGVLFQHGINVSMPAGAFGVSKPRNMMWLFDS